jgi:hypothetical protein
VLALALAESPRQGSGHPLWHYAVVAGVAVGVFLGIKITEYVSGRRSLSAGSTAPSVATTVLVAASLLSGGIHGSVTGEHFHEAFVFGLFFLVAAAAQVAWAVVLLRWPTRPLLWAGAIGNAVVIAVWVATRTVGIPIGPEPWQAEPVGVLDLASKVLEIVIIVTAVAVLARRASSAPGDVVERRLEELRREHPGLVRPRSEEPTPAASAVAGAAARGGFLLHEPASSRHGCVAPAVVEREGSCDVAHDDIVGKAVL